MLHRLRIKFILINMMLVTLVLLGVFASLFLSTAQQLEWESEAAMLVALRQEGMPPMFEFDTPDPGEGRKWQNTIPVFCVTVDQEGNILTLNSGERVKVSQQVQEQAVEQALASGANRGVLRDLGLRYRMEDTEDSTIRIAFSDLSWERSSLTRLVLNSALVGAAALGGFFLISLFLARLALKPVEETWEQQRQFVADASHELKTPLTVILANAGIVESHPTATVAEEGKWIAYIREEAQRMKGLVEDMLFLAKYDDARRPKGVQDCSLSDLVTGCVLRFESVAFEAEVALDSEIEPDLRVRGDPDGLDRLVMILLDNAVKYAGQAGSVSVALKRRQERGVLTVCNSGEPIPPEHLERLFQRFYRVDSSRSRQAGGYGLGLAIAHTIVQSHRGQIEVRSSREEGTVFTVTLPLRRN